MVLKSTGSPACVLRFANERSTPVRVLWLDYEGDEVPYGTVQPHCSFNQATYTKHPWRLRDEATGEIVGEYVGPTATLTVTVGGTRVVPGLHRVPQANVTHPVFGTYRQRGEVMGVPIMAFDCVAQEAVGLAVETMCYMLADVDNAVVTRLVEQGGEVAIIGCRQLTSDIPAHSHLKGLQCGNGGGTYDESTRGVGGHMACPVTSVGEENVLMAGDDRYPSESILVHEFAHAVMDLGLTDTPLREAIVEAYRAARESGAYNNSSYIMANESEYWAEASQAWFNATVRTDVTSGLTTREALKARDPRLAAVMARVWGDGAWRYPLTAPCPFAPFVPKPRAQQQRDYTSQSHAERLWREVQQAPGGYPAVVNGGQTVIVGGPSWGPACCGDGGGGGGLWARWAACWGCDPGRDNAASGRQPLGAQARQPILRPPSGMVAER